MFRQSALNRLATPDELDQLMQVTSPRLWLAGLAVALVVAAGLAWSALTVATNTVPAAGALAGGVHGAELFVPLDQAQRVAPGMDASVRVLGNMRARTLTGTVTAIGGLPATPSTLLDVFHNSTYVQTLVGTSPVVPVRVQLASDGTAPAGALLSGSITVSKQRLIRLLFP